MEEKKDKLININIVDVVKILQADRRKICIYFYSL